MSIQFASVGMIGGFAGGAGGVEDVLAVAGLIAAGLVLLFAAGRLCGRHGQSAHVARYSIPRL
jgi:hypothetical protein